MTSVAAAPPAATAQAPNILFVHAGAELYGADRVLLELLAGLKQSGHGLHVVLPTPGPLHAEIAQLGVPVQQRNLAVLRRKYFSLPGLLNRARRLCSAVLFLRRLIREQRIDIKWTGPTTTSFSRSES